MGFFKSIGKAFKGAAEGVGSVGSVINPGFLIGGPLGGLIYGEHGLDISGAGARSRADELAQQLAQQRAGAKAQQYQLLGQLQSPALTPQMETRIKALEDQSKASSLVEDPFFQGARARAVTGGAKELAGVGGRQQAYDVSGGFKNIGSMQDIYDRLGSQLAQIGQQSIQRKDVIAQNAAKMRQGIADAQLEFNNNVTKMKMAIESGDAVAAQQAMKDAAAAKEAIRQRTQQLIMGAAQLGLGFATASPGTAMGGARNIASSQMPGMDLNEYNESLPEMARTDYLMGPLNTEASPMGYYPEQIDTSMAPMNIPSQTDYWSQQMNQPLGIQYGGSKPWRLMR
ncbi:MAG: hypothetical protein RL316_459 [Bacteroidota bacterium]|jgi:hypothetical protein